MQLYELTIVQIPQRIEKQRETGVENWNPETCSAR